MAESKGNQRYGKSPKIEPKEKSEVAPPKATEDTGKVSDEKVASETKGAAPKAEEASGTDGVPVGERHMREVGEMMKRHQSEVADMHGRFEKEHADIRKRHTAEMKPSAEE